VGIGALTVYTYPVNHSFENLLIDITGCDRTGVQIPVRLSVYIRYMYVVGLISWADTEGSWRRLCPLWTVSDAKKHDVVRSIMRVWRWQIRRFVCQHSVRAVDY